MSRVTWGLRPTSPNLQHEDSIGLVAGDTDPSSCVCIQARTRSQLSETWLGLCQGTKRDDVRANCRKRQSLGTPGGTLTRVPSGVMTWAALAQHASSPQPLVAREQCHSLYSSDDVQGASCWLGTQAPRVVISAICPVLMQKLRDTQDKRWQS